jgi:hypothetical protein
MEYNPHFSIKSRGTPHQAVLYILKGENLNGKQVLQLVFAKILRNEDYNAKFGHLPSTSLTLAECSC